MLLRVSEGTKLKITENKDLKELDIHADSRVLKRSTAARMSPLFNFTFIEVNQHGQNQKRSVKVPQFWRSFWTTERTHLGALWGMLEEKGSNLKCKSKCVLGLFSYSGKTVSAAVRNASVDADRLPPANPFPHQTCKYFLCSRHSVLIT